jgi:hypothetical protein
VRGTNFYRILDIPRAKGAKNAKFGNLFCFFATFAPLREIFRVLIAALPR